MMAMSKVRVALLALCAVVAVSVVSAAFTEAEYAEMWSEYKANYEMDFSASEDASRFQTFKTNVDYVASSGNEACK